MCRLDIAYNSRHRARENLASDNLLMEARFPLHAGWARFFGFSINRPGDLDLLTSNLVRIITHRVGNLPTNFGIYETFCYWLRSQHLSDGPRYLATLTFNIGGHGACGWYGSLCSICVPRLNFAGLPFRKIWHTFGLIISRLGDLLMLKPVRNIARGMGNLHTNLGVSGTFRSRLMGQHL